MMRYGVVGVGYFGADLARLMMHRLPWYTTLKMVKPLRKNYNA